jgi:PAS domain S-box-containing protein
MTSGIRKLKIGPRLILCFALIILLMVAGNVLLAWQFRLVHQHSDRVSALAQELVVVSRFQTDLLSLDAKLDSLAKSEDIEGLRQETTHSRPVLVTDIEAIRDALVHLPSDLGESTPTQPIVEAVGTTLSSQLDAVVNLGEASDWNAVRLRLADEKKPLETRASDLVRSVQQQVGVELVRSVTQSERLKSRILLILPLTAFFTLLFATLLGAAITRSITVPLRQLLKGSTALARGDFDYQVQLRGKDELAHVGAVFNQASTKLGELYRKLEEAQRIAQVGYWEWDLKTDRIIWSDEIYRIFGMRPQECPIDLAASRQRIHPDDWPFVAEAVKEALAGGARFDVEARIVRPTGELRIVHSMADVKRDASGRPYLMFGTNQDITDRKRAEEALQTLSRDLQESKAKLEEAQRITHVGYWERDFGTDRITWSDETYRIYGLKPQEESIDFAALRRKIYSEDWTFVSRALDEAIGGGTRYNIEYRVLRPTGEIRIVHSTGDVKRDASGRPSLMFGTVQDITDRRRAEQRLRESETYLAEAQKLSQTGSWAWNPATGDIRYRSEMFCSVLGFDPSGPLPRFDEFVHHIHPDDQATLRERFDKIVRDKEDFELDYRIVHPEKGIRDIHIVGHAVLDRSGNLVEFIGTVIDVTERKSAEQALQKSQLYLSEGQRLAHMGSWAYNPSGFFEYWSQELFKIYGLDPQKGAPTLEQYLATLHPADRDSMAETIKKMHADHSGCDVTKRIVRPDGEQRYIRCVGIPVIEGEVLKGFLGTAIDVTEQEMLTQELERQQAYLNEGQRLSHTASWAWGVSNEKAERLFQVHVSDEWYRIYGFDPADGPLYWERYSERIHPDDRVWWKSTIERAIQEKADYDEVVRLLLPGGIVKWIRIVGHPVLDTAGNLIQLVGSSSDITERKQAEQERERLRQLEADLAHVNRVSTLGEMAASLAHELKQPIAAAITSANSCLEWLAHEPPNLERARAAASRIDKYGNRAAEIIDRIRSFYRKSSPKRELVDVNSIVQEMLTLLKGEADRHSVTMHTELASGLPKIVADRVQLQQVFMNLMLNAIEAMKDSAGESTVGEFTVKSQLLDGQLQVSVSDTGPGLPAGNVDQIFSAFFTTKSQGSGMGLAISRSIVESHGGRLWAAANDGRGATFYFTLPTEVS